MRSAPVGRMGVPRLLAALLSVSVAMAAPPPNAGAVAERRGDAPAAVAAQQRLVHRNPVVRRQAVHELRRRGRAADFALLRARLDPGAESDPLVLQELVRALLDQAPGATVAAPRETPDEARLDALAARVADARSLGFRLLGAEYFARVPGPRATALFTRWLRDREALLRIAGARYFEAQPALPAAAAQAGLRTLLSDARAAVRGAALAAVRARWEHGRTAGPLTAAVCAEWEALADDLAALAGDAANAGRRAPAWDLLGEVRAGLALDAPAELLAAAAIAVRDPNPVVVRAALGFLGRHGRGAPVPAGLDRLLLAGAPAAAGAVLDYLDTRSALSESLRPYVVARLDAPGAPDLARAAARVLARFPGTAEPAAVRAVAVLAAAPDEAEEGLLRTLARRENDPAVRAAALTALAGGGGGPSDPRAMTTAFAALAAPNAPVREAALDWFLTAPTDGPLRPAALPGWTAALRALIFDPSPTVRVRAARTAARFPPPVPVWTLPVAGAEVPPGVEAALALRLRPAGVPPFEPVAAVRRGSAFEADPLVRAVFVEALGELTARGGDQRLLAALIRALEDDAWTVRAAAARALAAVAAEEAIGPLIDALAVPQSGFAAHEALHRIAALDLGADPRPWRAWWGRFQDQRRRLLARDPDRDAGTVDARLYAARALGGPDAGGGRLPRAPLLDALRHDPAWEVQVACVRALARLEAPRRAAGEPFSPRVAAAFRALLAPDATPAEAVRLEVLAVVGELLVYELSADTAALAGDTDRRAARVQEAAVRALGRLVQDLRRRAFPRPGPAGPLTGEAPGPDYDRALAVLLARLADRTPAVRVIAIEALRDLFGPAVAAPLFAADPALRRAGSRAFHRLALREGWGARTEDALPLATVREHLLRALEDRQRLVSFHAGEALAALGAEEVRADAPPVPDGMSADLAWANQWPSPTVDALIPLATHETRAVRQGAFDALAAITGLSFDERDLWEHYWERQKARRQDEARAALR